MSGKPLLSLLLFLLPFQLFAATFTVTNPGDNGPGTLRQALQDALNNGTTEIDSIIFSTVDISVQGRTIVIESELPAIGSNTVIYGGNQPGLAIGQTSAKIRIVPGAGFPSLGTLLTVTTGATNVSIYGLSLLGNSAVHPSIVNAGIAISNSTNIQVGDQNIGNHITGFKTGILFSGGVSQNITIAYNIIGLNDTANITTANETNELSIDAENVYNISVLYNTLYGTTNAFKFNTNIQGIAGSLTFSNNNIGTDIFGFALKAYPATQASNLVYISGNAPNGQYDSLAVFNINLSNNFVLGNAATGIYFGNGLANVALKFSNNTIGTDKSSSQTASSIAEGVYIGYLGRPWGSSLLPPADFSSNKIFLCSKAGVTQEYSYVYFDRNTFHCNTQGIVSNTSADNVITIDSISGSTISGTCSAAENITIDLYIASTCGGCQGFTKITSFVKQGNATTWTYCGFLQGRIVALSSFPGANSYSGSFSNCVQSPNNIAVTQATCKNRKGDIKGVFIPADATIVWRNANGDSVSNKPNLVGVAPGTYYYEVKSQTGCNYSSSNFTITVTGYPSLVSTFAKVFPEICGSDGAIEYIRANEKDSIRWVDSATNTIVGHSATLSGQPAGTYKMFVGKDSGCVVSSPWYTIVDTTTRIDSSAFVITRDTCNKMSGSITYSSKFPADYLFWWTNPGGNATDTNAYRIDTLDPGNYTLNIQRVNYDSSCTSTYGPYNIVKVPGISFDATNLTIRNASCNSSNGSIVNMMIANQKGNVNYQWVDSTGKVAGTGIDLLNIPGGSYRLQCKDESGCDTFYSAYFQVINEGVIGIDTSNLLVKAATCKGPDGFIKNIVISNANSYQWVNIATNTTVGNTVDIANLAAGNYQLNLNNALNCKTQTNIINVPQSVFDTVHVTGSTKEDAHCNLINGFVNLTSFDKDTLLYTYEWIDKATGTSFSTSSQITGLDSGTYEYYATDTNGCRGVIYTAAIIQTGVPAIDDASRLVSSDSCSLGRGSIYNVNATGGGGTYTWEWYKNPSQQLVSTSKPLTSASAGDYYAIVKDQFNCSVTTSTYTINNVDVVLAAASAPDVSILRGRNATIRVRNLVNGMYYLYDSPSSTQPIDSSRDGVLLTPALTSDATFYIRVRSGSCYSDYSPVKVFVFDKSTLLIPNVFSPNGDGINDTWVITPVGVVNLDNLTVFNRWGQAVYTTRDLNTAWRGTMNGNPLPVGTYYYTLQAKDIEGKPFKMSGNVTILK